LSAQPGFHHSRKSHQGHRIGAILSTLYASLRPSEGLKSLILLTAPLDFTDTEQISLARMTDERYFDVDRVLQAFDNMPAGPWSTTAPRCSSR
jgi:poly(3-hydroxyalkanoate) synthetase